MMLNMKEGFHNWIYNSPTRFVASKMSQEYNPYHKQNICLCFLMFSKVYHILNSSHTISVIAQVVGW
jgi:hypothetical protein